MSHHHRWGAILLGMCLLFGGQTAVFAQEPTPEPIPLTVVVEAEDSLWSIAVNAGLTLDELLALNDLTETAVIQPGQTLIVGYLTPTAVSPTITAPAATLLPPTPRVRPTAVPPPLTGLCLLAFDDANGNGLYEGGESKRASVAFTVYSEQAVLLNYVTDGESEPHCVTNLPPGAYTITRSRTSDERLTTPGERGILINSGAMVEMQFGSTTDPSVAIGNAQMQPEPVTLGDGEASMTPTPTTTAVSTQSPRQNTAVWIGSGLLLIAALFFIINRSRQ